MPIIVNLVVIVLAVFTYWFFLHKKEAMAVQVQDKIKITVEGGYKPSVIEVEKGKPVTLQFYRTDPTSCLEEVVIPHFGIRQFLPVKQTVNVTILPKEVGEFPFHCGMSMFFGKIKVV